MLLYYKSNPSMLVRSTQLPSLSDPKFNYYNPLVDPIAHERVLQLERGIFMQEEYWRSKLINISYPISSMTRYSLTGSPKLHELVRKFHKLQNPNADFDQKELVFGVGATQVLHAILYAIYHKLKRKLLITVRTPGYLDIPETIPVLHTCQATYQPNLTYADVEFMATPNNPDGRLQTAQPGVLYTVYDRINFWPCYIGDDPSLPSRHTFKEEDITVFSLPKLNGFSGSRLGYAFIRDPELAHYARFYVVTQTHGLSIDSEIRHMTCLEWFMKDNNYQNFMRTMVETLQNRWNILRETLKSNSEIILLNSQGPNAWIQTPGKRAKDFLRSSYNIVGTYGPEYGASEDYARLNLLLFTYQFNEFIRRLRNTSG